MSEVWCQIMVYWPLSQWLTSSKQIATVQLVEKCQLDTAKGRPQTLTKIGKPYRNERMKPRVNWILRRVSSRIKAPGIVIVFSPLILEDHKISMKFNSKHVCSWFSCDALHISSLVIFKRLKNCLLPYGLFGSPLGWPRCTLWCMKPFCPF